MLNDAQLRAAKPRAKPYKLFDAHQLYPFVTPKGTKVWRMNFKYNGREKSLSFGAYPLVSLVAAREKRDEARRLLADGTDPSVAKKLKIKANIEASRNTFEKVAREWHEINAPQWAKVHAGDVLRSLERDIFPSIGSLPIKEISPPKVLEVLRRIEQRSAIETAKRIRQRTPIVRVGAALPRHKDHKWKALPVAVLSVLAMASQ